MLAIDEAWSDVRPGEAGYCAVVESETETEGGGKRFAVVRPSKSVPCADVKTPICDPFDTTVGTSPETVSNFGSTP